MLQKKSIRILKQILVLQNVDLNGKLNPESLYEIKKIKTQTEVKIDVSDKNGNQTNKHLIINEFRREFRMA